MPQASQVHFSPCRITVAGSSDRSASAVGLPSRFQRWSTVTASQSASQSGAFTSHASGRPTVGACGLTVTVGAAGGVLTTAASATTGSPSSSPSNGVTSTRQRSRWRGVPGATAGPSIPAGTPSRIHLYR